ncbi:flagellar basal body L-ring protein FlgH [Kamptonema cortianum]|nr:flagellar basal body L-ring protein FlgH [Geitlerinema splendidum]MDK3161091.1 flagellar basal body L-ring protein FlgH [Kamptonema cortianum]
MKKLIGVVTAALLAASVLAQTGGKQDAGSIHQTTGGNAYIDRVARAKGDILMIVINEQSAASFAAATKSSKGDNNAVTLDIFKGLLGRLFGPLTNTGSSSTSGSGDTTRTSKMNAKMSAIVKEVLPNGTLIIEGSRTLITNKETQTLVLSGIIRASDITPENTIDSTKIAEAEIKMDGKGLVSERQRKGILTQILDWLF